MRLVALAITLLAVSAAASAESLRATAEKMGTKASIALAHKNFKAFAAILRPYVTSDFQYTEMGKSMGFDQMIAGVKQGVGMLNVTSAHSRILSCVEHGKTGITTTTHNIAATMIGKDKKVHPMAFSGNSKDTWVKVDGTWKMSIMAWGSQKMTMDGKPVNQGGGGGPDRGRK